jgi:tryptophan synthase beta chain
MEQMPDGSGYFGKFGGRFVPETLINIINELEGAYKSFCSSDESKAELKTFLEDYAGRATPLYFAKNLSAEAGCSIYLKREDLLHTGAHKINNALGQILLARHMGKTRIIAETGAGQHGVATATVCALMGLECVIYMGELDVRRQAPNVKRMELLGARVVPVTSGSKTLKDAMNEAIRDWVENCRNTYYLIGTVGSAHPFPMIVRDFQKIIGEEALAQFHAKKGKLPDYAVACIGGGSNAAGLFYPMINSGIKLIGVEAGGRSDAEGDHCCSLTLGRPGILHGNLTYLLQNVEGQIIEGHSISAGLDYPGVGPEHSYWKDEKLVDYVSCSDSEALEALKRVTKLEGIIPALESSHAIGYVLNNRDRFAGSDIIINLSGRGDKDLGIIFNEVKQ